RAAARALARMFREGPRLVFTRPMPIQKSKNVFARPDNNHHKREVESFQTMLNERRRRGPHLVVDNDNTRPPARPAARGAPGPGPPPRSSSSGDPRPKLFFRSNKSGARCVRAE